MTIVPGGAEREVVARAYIDFLQHTGSQQSSRIEWFLPVNTLLHTILRDQSLASLAEEIRNSENGVISLYAWLGAVAARPPIPPK